MAVDGHQLGQRPSRNAATVGNVDWNAYLQDLADSRLRIARLADDRYKATATNLALTEVKGAGEALVAAGLLRADEVATFLTTLHRDTGAELVRAGLAETVSIETSESMRVSFEPKARRQEG